MVFWSEARWASCKCLATGPIKRSSNVPARCQAERETSSSALVTPVGREHAIASNSFGDGIGWDAHNGHGRRQETGERDRRPAFERVHGNRDGAARQTAQVVSAHSLADRPALRSDPKFELGECPFPEWTVTLCDDSLLCRLVSRGDRTAIELFLAGLQCWEAGLRRSIDDGKATPR